MQEFFNWVQYRVLTSPYLAIGAVILLAVAVFFVH